MDFEGYLKMTHTAGTIKRYAWEVDLYCRSVAGHERAGYRQIMAYLLELRKVKKDIGPSLYAIKNYYRFLVVSGVREDDPAQSIRLRDQKRRDVQLQDLFETVELEQLLDRKERYQVLKNRNRLIISLLIYQALTNREICELEVTDFDLEQGTVYIKGSHRSNARTLKLESKQVYWLMNYTMKDRPELLKTETKKLIVSKRGRAESGEGISYVIETLKPLFPDRKLNPKTIRQSVIRNLLKAGKDLRLVQAFAGHKYPSTTERYRQTGVEELKQQVLKYHPLD